MDRKVFDINTPTRVTTPATSRPVIVGHQPIMADPMVRPAASPLTAPAFPTHTPTTIQVTDEIRNDLAQAERQEVALPQPAVPSPAAPPEPPQPMAAPAPAESTALSAPPAPPMPEHPMQPQNLPLANESAADDTEPAAAPQSAQPPQQPIAVPTQAELSHLPHMPIAHSHHKGGRLRTFVLWAIIAVFLIGLAAFLATDAGLIGNADKLPFHIFSQD